MYAHKPEVMNWSNVVRKSGPDFLYNHIIETDTEDNYVSI